MQTHIRNGFGTASMFFVLATILFLVPGSIEANNENRFERYQKTRETYEARVVKRVCAQIKHLYKRLPFEAELPAFCKSETPPSPQPVVTLTADPQTIEEGNASEIEWSSTNATTCTASNGWSGDKNLSGSQQVTPTVTTTYALTCTGTGGSDSETVTITVTEDEPEPEAPVIAFSAEPNTITEGGSSTLSWNVTNATTCTASDGWSGSRPVSDDEMVSPIVTTGYTLSCSGAGGNDTETVTVTVNPVPPTLDHVVINEVAWMGTATDADDEWVELFNPTGNVVDLTGWTIAAEDGVPSLVLSGSIPAGGFFLLERGDDTTVPGETANQIYPTGALENGGETLILSNGTPAVIDTVVGGTNWGNIGGNNTTKETPQRTTSDTWVTGTPTPKAATP